ncbi:trissin receptor [Trichomycterus rosablanca]|uniref:trissin receptor n=1 Tax=Trichomycterus rosablanca TaxID=2290929 RepID=UPI002F3566C7
MEQRVLALLVLRIILSAIGIAGNTVLIISILHLSKVKTFEVFLLGLAITNLEEIVSVEIYDAVVLQSAIDISVWSCSTIKFLASFGEAASIFFTVLISIFRYQKLHNAAKRIITPILMDNIISAVCLSLGCIFVSVLVSIPVIIINQSSIPHIENFTIENCTTDFFQCSKDYCPTFNNVYKILFIVIVHILPLLIVTATSVLIIRILIVQQNAVDSHHNSDPPALAAYHHHHHHHEHDVFHRSTIGILSAMTLFQLYCILYLINQLMFTRYDMPAWSEMEFFIATIYTGIIPYIYGTGHNFFSLKHFM